MHKTKLHLSKDGSHTVYSDLYEQFFHNPNGAIAESRHVFFDTPELTKKLTGKDRITIFEVGFGTGLNLLLLLEKLNISNITANITYHAIEAHPVSVDLAARLNYPEKLDLPNAAEILACVFRDLKPGENEIRISRHLNLKLFKQPFESFGGPKEKYHYILFDPFSPDVNEELWTREVFEKLAGWSEPDVLLSTYCAASSARAAMASAGWHVARAPGALGKREMTLAALNPKLLVSWKRVNEVRLRERYDNGEFSNQREQTVQ